MPRPKSPFYTPTQSLTPQSAHYPFPTASPPLPAPTEPVARDQEQAQGGSNSIREEEERIGTSSNDDRKSVLSGEEHDRLADEDGEGDESRTSSNSTCSGDMTPLDETLEAIGMGRYQKRLL